MSEWMGGLREMDWQSLAVLWGMRLLAALAVVVVGIWVARLVAGSAQKALGRAGVDSMLAGFLRNIAYAALIVLVLISALGTLGVQTTSLLAVVGAAGLAIGLALQGSLANIAAGIMLISLRPFKAGDFVSIADQDGTVEQVKVFQTVLRTPDNREITLPNSQITSAPIINFSARSERRADLTVGIGYEQDIASARKLLLAIASEHPNVLAEPATDVLASALGESSVDLTLRVWIATPDFIATRSDLVEAIHRRFGEAGISIPFPQREVSLQLDAPTLEALRALRPAAGQGTDTSGG